VTDLDYIRNIAGRDHGLAVVAVARDDGTVAASVVNVGVLAHPVDGKLWRNVMLAQETATALECAVSVVVLTAAHDGHAEEAVQGIRPLLVDPDSSVTHALLEDVIAAVDDEPRRLPCGRDGSATGVSTSG
jgi:hypothetical protein